VTYDVVIPSSGRPTLPVLLAALGGADGPLPERVIVVDDRPAGAAPLDLHVPAALGGRSFVVRRRRGARLHRTTEPEAAAA
jgi:hypothetical protein